MLQNLAHLFYQKSRCLRQFIGEQFHPKADLPTTRIHLLTRDHAHDKISHYASLH